MELAGDRRQYRSHWKAHFVNILSFALALAAIVVFAAAYRGLPWGTLGLGLLLLTAAWVIQLLWVTADQITF